MIPDDYELATNAQKCQLGLTCRIFYMSRPMTVLAVKVMLAESLRATLKPVARKRHKRAEAGRYSLAKSVPVPHIPEPVIGVAVRSVRA